MTTTEPHMLDRVGQHLVQAIEIIRPKNGDFIRIQVLVGAGLTMESPTIDEIRKRLRHEADLLPGYLLPGREDGGTFGVYFYPLLPWQDAIKRALRFHSDEVPKDLVERIKSSYASLTDSQQVDARRYFRKKYIAAVRSGTLASAKVYQVLAEAMGIPLPN